MANEEYKETRKAHVFDDFIYIYIYIYIYVLLSSYFRVNIGVRVRFCHTVQHGLF